MKETFCTKEDIKKVDQTTFGAPYGNCFSACIASLTHLNILAVPNFNQWELVFGRAWYAAKIWCFHHGFFMSDLYHWDKISSGILYDGEVFIAGGTSPRKLDHAVLWTMKDGCVHDPHPSRGGFTGEPVDATIIRKHEDIRPPFRMM